MAGPSQIVAVVAAGGALYLVWKMTKSSAPPPPTDPCAGLSGEDLLICKAAGIGAGIIGAVAGAVTTNPDRAFAAERDRRKAINDQLNGPPDTALVGDVTGYTTLRGDATLYSPLPPSVQPLRYANGCEPFYASPGWSKCKAGTLDMYEMAIEQAPEANGGGLSNPKILGESDARVIQVFETPAAFEAAKANNQKAHDNGDDSHWYQTDFIGMGFDPTPVEKLNKDHFGTGASGDPITAGPWVDGAGVIWWLVRGKRFNAPAGKVPLAIAIRVTARGFETDADRDAKIIALTDDQAVSLIDVGTYGAGSGTGNTTNYAGCPAIVANPNLTWDAATSSWQRLKAGAKRNLGPCATSTTHSSGHASEINVIGDHYGIGAP